MTNYRILLTADNVGGCPIYKKGDQVVVNLPEVDMDSTNRVCAFVLAELLKNGIKRDKNAICERKENFASKEEYLKEFGLEEGSLLCPRVSCEVSFKMEVEESGGFFEFQKQAFPGEAQKNALVKKLQKIPILSSINPSDLMDILPEIKVKSFKPKDVIIKKGEAGKHFFVIYKGLVEIVDVTEQEEENIIGTIGRGECFGEMSLLTGEPVSATIRAASKCYILVIGRHTFKQLMVKNPVLGLTFTKLLSSRIKSTNRNMNDMIASGMNGQLQTIRFPELVQTLGSTDCTGVLHLDHEGEAKGEVFFQNGEIINVFIDGEAKGNDGFYQMIVWEKGKFRFENTEDLDCERLMFDDVMSLLLEGMRRLDEESRHTAEFTFYE